MKTLDEIAKGVVKAAVRTRGEGTGYVEVVVDDTPVDWFVMDGAAAATRQRLTGPIERVVLKALREAMSLPGEPPVSEEQIEQTQCLNNDAGFAWSHRDATERIAKLLAQLDHYRRLAALLMREPEGQCYAAGYGAGRAAALRDVRAIVAARMTREQDDADKRDETGYPAAGLVGMADSAGAARALHDLLAELGG